MQQENQNPSFQVLDGSSPVDQSPKPEAGRWLNTVNDNLILAARWLINAILLGLGDAAGLFLALLAGGSIRAYIMGDPMLPEWSWFLIFAWVISAIGIRFLPGWGLGPVEELRRTVLLLLGVFAATSTALFLAKLSFATSRLTISLSFLISLPLLPIIRLQLKRLLIRLRLWGMQSIIYGNRDTAKLVIEAVNEEPGLGYVPVAVCDYDNEIDDTHVETVPVISREEAEQLFTHVAILAQPGMSRHRTLEMFEGPLSVYRHVVIIPDLFESPSLWVKTRDVGGILGLEISSNLLDAWTRFIKRMVDLLTVTVTAPLWLPLVLLIGLAIWLQDLKNPLFIHERVGQGGRMFRIWKFRTMRHDAEQVLQQQLSENDKLRIEWETNFKLRKDPRITPLGRFLRRTSMDELPQLYNVLKGEMSLVGPRPLPKYHLEELSENTRRMREKVRPGITGLWQVSGRSEAGNEGIEKRDTYYVRNWSIWLDVVILFRTIRAVIRKEGAC